jgi:hypothetical protein
MLSFTLAVLLIVFTGMPCMHACSTLALRGLKPEEHCHAWLTLGSYRATYNYFIQPVNSQIYWEPTPYEKPVPLKLRRAAGRPKKNKRKDGNEEPLGGSQMKRTYNDTQCGRCGLIGHNLRGCNKQGVVRRPKDWIDTKPEEENVGGNADNAGNDGGVAENPGHVVAGNDGHGGVAENHGHVVAGNDGQVAQNVSVGNVAGNEAVLRQV